MTSLYKVLGVEKDATQDEIKAAYRKLASKHHPDKEGGNGDREAFQVIQEAYAVLSDPERRARYDHDGTYRNMAAPTEEEQVTLLANNGLMEVMSHIISNTEHVEYTDIFGGVVKQVKEMLGKFGEEREGLLKGIEKHQTVLDRIKPKEGTDDTAGLLLRTVIGKIEAEVRKADFAIKVGNRMVEIMSGYDYLVDEMPADVKQKLSKKQMDKLAEILNRQFGFNGGPL